jgi:hypothetical protein
MNQLAIRKTGAALGLSLAALLGLASQDAQAQATCSSKGACLDAVLAAARSGRDIDEIAPMHQLRDLRSTQGKPGIPRGSLPPRAPETLGVGNVERAHRRSGPSSAGSALPGA